MRCYKCGCDLSEKDFCTSCGADVGTYKQIIFLSNQYYNEGLERAQVRDLTGAKEKLRQCLKMNKTHTQARNLLGLVYFELGELVEALTEWVISTTYQPEKNIATDYIGTVQSSPAALDGINTTIHKYNLALNYCRQGSLDMARIQLKKVVNTNPRLLKARQLLALLYIKDEEWEKAKRELEPCRKIDIGNVLTNHYLREVNEMLKLGENHGTKKKENSNAVYIQSGNDIIIQPKQTKEPRGFGLLLNILVGLVIGLAIGWFLLAPLRMRFSERNVETELQTAREELASKSSDMEEMSREYAKLQEQYDETAAKLASYEEEGGDNADIKNLMLAQIEYDKGDSRDPIVIAGYLANIDETYVEQKATDEFKTMYDLMMSSVGGAVGEQYMKAGDDAFRISDYTSAIENYKKASQYDIESSDALFALADAYRLNGEKEMAIATYVLVKERFPESENAARAETFISELSE
ncbi:MAG: tetratricopeptide repeat protein [Lachnospiraceae bacterium]|nr:tetratricopeptide repeat protein [Lachnospiraceae bacterium]